MTTRRGRSVGLSHFVANAALLALLMGWSMGRAAGVRIRWPALTLSATSGHCQFVTTQGICNGHRISYRATVADTIVKSSSGKPAASIFTFAYTATGERDPVARPALFIFNGGPCAASNTFLLGAFGPRRMRSMTVADRADPRVPLVPNPLPFPTIRSQCNYPGGHIRYSDWQGLAKFTSDVRTFTSGSSDGNYPAARLTLR